jgi:hypothetical protein
MPCFLRARRDALLAPAAQAGERPAPPPMGVNALERNAANERSSWWWKGLPYYRGAVWHADGASAAPASPSTRPG